MDVCSTGNHDNLPEMSELRKTPAKPEQNSGKTPMFHEANSMMDFGHFEPIHSCQCILDKFEYSEYL